MGLPIHQNFAVTEPVVGDAVDLPEGLIMLEPHDVVNIGRKHNPRFQLG
jgi:hypothetical protein